MTATPIDCRFCGHRHMPRFLCDQARDILASLAAKADRWDVPDLEFKDVPMDIVTDVIMRQVTVSAGSIPVGNKQLRFPAIVISGRDQHANPLPRWTYTSDPGGMEKVKQLFVGKIDLAIQAAKR